jgi:(2R)-3-sulfolactate dehydrogenase (NADP+)
MPRLSLGELDRLAVSLLRSRGLGADEALSTAKAMTTADAWGLRSHGTARLPRVLDRLDAGGYVAEARLVPRVDTGPLLVLDGGGGVGYWQVTSAVSAVCGRAADHGTAAVFVGDSGHCGALGIYAQAAALQGMVCAVFSHGAAAVPAWGSAQPLLSTSPLAAAVPLRPRPMVIDLSLSAVSRGQVSAALDRGEQLGEGQAFDADGRPTLDPAAALEGALAPLGGAKGFALGLLVEALTAVLVGPRLSADVPALADTGRDEERQGIGHTVIAIAAGLTDAAGEASGPLSRMEDLHRRVEASGGRLPGVRRPLPDELRDDLELEVAEAVLQSLRERT